MRVREIDTSELKLFGEIVGDLSRPPAASDIRAYILEKLIRLLRADGGASYVWLDAQHRFSGAIYSGMAPEIQTLYDQWFQFNDPMTARLRTARRATIVDEVLNRPDLLRTEFYNDFLRRDKLEWGINIYLFDDDGRDLGDFRIWRRHGRSNFDDREKALLDVLEPHLRSALAKIQVGNSGLTPREREVSSLVARGCTDRDIARILGISFSTVRTHLNRALDKRGCANRTELAGTFSRTN